MCGRRAEWRRRHTDRHGEVVGMCDICLMHGGTKPPHRECSREHRRVRKELRLPVVLPRPPLPPALRCSSSTLFAALIPLLAEPPNLLSVQRSDGLHRASQPACCRLPTVQGGRGKIPPSNPKRFEVAYCWTQDAVSKGSHCKKMVTFGSISNRWTDPNNRDPVWAWSRYKMCGCTHVEGRNIPAK